MANSTSDDNFDSDVLKSEGYVLVDFWAEWCGPCKQLAPILDEVSNDMGDKLSVYKLNIDENPETPTGFNVRGIPTMILFKDGDVIGTKVGALPKSSLVEWIEQTISA